MGNDIHWLDETYSKPQVEDKGEGYMKVKDIVTNLDMELDHVL